jgi:Flp pilus assembly protein TadB
MRARRTGVPCQLPMASQGQTVDHEPGTSNPNSRGVTVDDTRHLRMVFVVLVAFAIVGVLGLPIGRLAPLAVLLVACALMMYFMMRGMGHGSGSGSGSDDNSDHTTTPATWPRHPGQHRRRADQYR